MISSSIPSIRSKVQADVMMHHLRELEKHVKLSGSPEEALSLDYVERQLEAYGYSTERLHHDAYISLPGPARLVLEGEELPCITHCHARPTQSGGLTAKLVYVGRGTPADLARQPVEGTILLVDGISSNGVTLGAARAGALAQVHISPHDYPHEGGISPVWGNPGLSNVGELPETSVVSVDRSVGERLKAHLERKPHATVTIYAEVDTGWRKIPLLVADMDAPDPVDDTFVLLSGHHDTWHQGVMDNGSANAAMLEVARVAAGHRDVWKRGLRICFWSGHSHGKYAGSAWYADRFWHDLERRCVAHVNLDSVGCVGASVLEDAPANLGVGAVADEVIRVETGCERRDRRMQRNCDMSFWGIGIPAMFGLLSVQAPEHVDFEVPCGWWWHTPADTIDKIDPGYMERDTRIALHATWSFLCQAVLPLDIGAYVGELSGFLSRIQLSPGHDLDLAPVVDSLRLLQMRVDTLADSHGALPPKVLNDTLMRLSRVFVPLENTSGDRFGHNGVQAAAVMPDSVEHVWPSLLPLAVLAACPVDTDEARFANVDAARVRNLLAERVAHANAIALEAMSRHP